MASTAASSNNKSVSFGTKMEREMTWNNEGISRDGSGKNPAGVKNTAPIKPASQADGAVNPAGVKNTAPMKKRGPKTKAARKTVKSAIKRGMISETAAKKHLGGY
jgi:hypothetical protein